MLSAIRIRVCQALAGQDRPIASDGVLYVSPAMASVMDGATEQELRHLLSNLYPIEIPGLFAKEMTCQA